MNRTITILLVLQVLFIVTSCEKKKAAPAPLAVAVTGVVQQDVRLESEFTGQTYGESDVEIVPRVNGLVESLNFKEGQLVKKGQLLYTIDPLPYKNKVEQAAGQLAEAQTNLAKSKADLDMIEPLAKINAVSQRELVAARAQYEAAKGKIQSAEGSLRNAKIELGYCSITAPISGLIGISKVRVGDYVSPGPLSKINTVSELSKVRVRFTISEQEFLRIFREVQSENSALKGAGQSVSLKLSDGSMYPKTGKLSIVDRQIDPSTGAMTFEASFENTDYLIRPGQYVKVLVVTDVRKDAILIPQRSVIEMQGISQVFVLGDSSKVNLKIISTGPTYKDAYVVVNGLSAGDKIAFGGTSLLRSGSTITPKPVEWQPGSPISDKATSK